METTLRLLCNDELLNQVIKENRTEFHFIHYLKELS